MSDMLEVVIDSIRVSLMSQQRIVILREANAERYLPIWIGVYEAESITIALQEVEVAPPLSHDLVKNIFNQLNARVVRVEVVALRDDTYYGYFDIETAPLTIRAFRTGRQYVSWRNIEQEGFVLCWAAIWVGKNKVLSDGVLPKEAKKQNDKRCLSGLWELMDQADYVVGHNMRAFDCKYVEGRFIKFGWDAPYNTKIVDTLTISRRKFRLSSHSLDALLKMFEEDENEMNEQDWRNCLHGDEKALKKMVTYCRGDVRKGVSILKRFQKYIESGGGKPLFT